MTISETESPASAPATTDWPSPAVLDASCRWPVLYLYAKAVVWLVIGMALFAFSTVKWHGGGADTAWLTIGRIRPAAFNALLYGFAVQAGLGTMVWLFARLGRNPLVNGSLMIFAGAIWNLGVLCGVVAILAGHSTGFRWLEMPGFVAFLLFAGYVLMGTWIAINVHLRTQRELYVSQWYLLAALFFFPWLYSAANYLLLAVPPRGVVQVVVNAWYANGLLWLCLAPVGLAILYYFIPKLVARPMQNRAVAVFGFWTYILAAPWMGLVQYSGGPFPVWMVSASISGSILLLLPLLAIGLNWGWTVQSQSKRPANLLSRFVTVAALAFLLGGLLHVLNSFRLVSRITQFTAVPIAIEHLLLFGFVGMALFAAMYHILPRVSGVEWPSVKLIRFHFLCSTGGLVLLVIGLGIGGVVHGVRLHDPAVDAVRLARGLIPFLGVATLGALALLIGQLIFAINVCKLFRRFCEVACSSCCGWLRRGEVASP